MSNVVQTIARRSIQRGKFILISLNDVYPVIVESQGLESDDHSRAILRMCERLGIELTVRQKESIKGKVRRSGHSEEAARQPISEELLR